jgi:sigma-B regulation protein RsbU (phosphoserine phosphatase)
MLALFLRALDLAVLALRHHAARSRSAPARGRVAVGARARAGARGQRARGGAAPARADNARKTAELEAARRLQISLLPATLPALPDVEVAFAMRTATEVGGDYYDYRATTARWWWPWATPPDTAPTPDPGRDGEGAVPHHALEQGLRPALDRVSEGSRGLGLKRHHMSLALLRYAGGSVRFAAAGMPPLLVHRARPARSRRSCSRRRRWASPTTGPIPSAQPGRAGDTLLLTTDGLAERRNERDELFGYERCAPPSRSRALRRLRRRRRLFAASDDWAGGAARATT